MIAMRKISLLKSYVNDYMEEEKMKMIVFSGHSIKPYSMDCKLLDIIGSNDLRDKLITIGDKQYQMYYNPKSSADVCVAGWCLKDLDNTYDKYLGFTVVRGNVAILNTNETGLDQNDIDYIKEKISSMSDGWSVLACLSYTNIANQYSHNDSSISFEEILNYKELCKIVMNYTNPCLSQRKQIVERTGKTYYLDLETTGFTVGDDEIVSISIIDEDGCVVMDQLVKPKNRSIWHDAQAIHHISPAMVKDSPTFDEIKDSVLKIYQAADQVIIYNADFDSEFIAYAASEYELIESKSMCCMKRFAEIYGEYSEYLEDYKWQKLSKAMNYYHLSWIGDPHASLTDTYACRAVWIQMEKDNMPA